MHVLRTLAAGLLAAVTMASPALAVTCTVNSSDGLNIRSEATTNSSIVAVMSNGSTMELLDTSNPYWFQISYNGYTGYVSTEHIKVNRESYRVVDGPLNIRSGPGASYELLGTLAQDEVVEVIGESNGWYQIAQGYIHGDYVEKVTAQAASTSSSSSGVAPTTRPSTTSSAPVGRVLINTDAVTGSSSSSIRLYCPSRSSTFSHLSRNPGAEYLKR